jgi:O-methyltransferase involved in polyketide biosynthesis
MKDLVGVSETLLVPLYARYLETNRPDGIIKDEKAAEVFAKIETGCEKFSRMSLTQLGVAIRTEIITQKIKSFMETDSSITVVNLGAGLSTVFFQVDDGFVNWYEIDLPAVRPIWEKTIGGTKRHVFVECSVLDFSWMKWIKNTASGRVIFIAEGLLMYLEEAEVRSLIIAIRDNFPGSEILVEAISPIVARHSKQHPAISKTTAEFRWGVASLREVEKWGHGITLLDELYYLDRYPERWGWIRLLRKFPAIRKSFKIGHLRFQGDPVSKRGSVSR